MKGTFDSFSQFTMREITKDDWEAYKSYRKEGLPLHFRPYFQEQGIDSPDMKDKFFDDFLQSPHYTMKLFALFDGDRIIGQTTIRFISDENEPKAVFGGSDITLEYQKKGLADILYNYRKAYLKESGFNGEIMMTIAPDNHQSQNAAIRNGFVKTGKQDNQGFDILKPSPPTSP